MRVPPPFLNYYQLKMYIFMEQQIFTTAYNDIVGKCVWCGEAGGISTVWTKPFPGKPIQPICDLHHWYHKRGSGKPDEVLNNPANVVLLHRKCHMDYGQTTEMTRRCFLHKRTVRDCRYNLEGYELAV